MEERDGIPGVVVKYVDIWKNTFRFSAAANALSIPPGEYDRKVETQRN
jgi:hypothetical protein